MALIISKQSARLITGYVDLLIEVNLLPPYYLRSQGDNLVVLKTNFENQKRKIVYGFELKRIFAHINMNIIW